MISFYEVVQRAFESGKPVQKKDKLTRTASQIAMVERQLLAAATVKRKTVRFAQGVLGQDVIDHFGREGFVVWNNSEVVVISL